MTDKELTAIERAATGLLMQIRESDARGKFFGPVDAATYLKRELEKTVPEAEPVDGYNDEEHYRREGWNAHHKAMGLE